MMSSIRKYTLSYCIIEIDFLKSLFVLSKLKLNISNNILSYNIF